MEERVRHWREHSAQLGAKQLSMAELPPEAKGAVLMVDRLLEGAEQTRGECAELRSLSVTLARELRVELTATKNEVIVLCVGG